MEFLAIYIHLITFLFTQQFWQKSTLDFFPGILTNILEYVPYAIKLFEAPMMLFVISWFLPISFMVGIYLFVSNFIKAKGNRMRMVTEWIPMLFFWWLCKI
jgi:uncharacterized membrane protein YecN with MAPEG domain